jgi:hypothetical protein
MGLAGDFGDWHRLWINPGMNVIDTEVMKNFFSLRCLVCFEKGWGLPIVIFVIGLFVLIYELLVRIL